MVDLSCLRRIRIPNGLSVDPLLYIFFLPPRFTPYCPSGKFPRGGSAVSPLRAKAISRSTRKTTGL